MFCKLVACVASVSAGLTVSFPARSLFGGAKIGASATLMEAAGRGKNASNLRKALRKRLLRRLALLGFLRLSDLFLSARKLKLARRSKLRHKGEY